MTSRAKDLLADLPDGAVLPGRARRSHGLLRRGEPRGEMHPHRRQPGLHRSHTGQTLQARSRQIPQGIRPTGQRTQPRCTTQPSRPTQPSSQRKGGYDNLKGGQHTRELGSTSGPSQP
jgi:hypothetical protein